VKRDPRLHGLTSDHHAALVLARRLARACAEGRGDAAEARRRFDDDLAPHFRAEEELLLPPLAAAGEEALVRRTLDEHAALRGHLAAAEAGDAARLAAFAAALDAHVRFEERELFPAAEAKLGPEALARVEAAAPHPRGR
jgi:hypothetical protein